MDYKSEYLRLAERFLGWDEMKGLLQSNVCKCIQRTLYCICKYEGVDHMAGSLVQFRVDESMNIKAANICEQLGMDLTTYLRMCMSRLVQENGVPFSMKLEEDAYLVTGNRKHFPSAPFIVTPRQMIDIVLKDI